MARYHAEIAKLIIYNSQKSKTFVSSFVTQPKLEEERLGQIFIIVEIKKKNIVGVGAADCQKFSDILSSSVRNNYYTKNRNLEDFGSESIELLFEAALQKTNRDLQTYLLQNEKKAIENFLDNINIILGVSLKHQVHLAAVGKIEAFLIRKNRIGNVLAASQGGGLPREEQQKVNPVKIFSHLISGNLESEEALFFSTPGLLDYFSFEKIKRIVKENSANKAAQNISSLLGEIDEKTAASAIIIKLTAGIDPARNVSFNQKKYFNQPRRTMIFKKPEKKNVQDSIAELLNRQDETNKIITPSLGGVIKRMLKKFKKSQEWKKGQKKEEQRYGFRLGETVKNYRQFESQIRHLPRDGGVKRRSRVNRHWLKLLVGILTVFRKQKPIKVKDKIPKATKKMKLTSKIILGVCLIFAVLFIQSLFTLSKKRTSEKRTELFSQEIERIKREEERATSRLIIGDKKTALEAYENILAAIKDLPPGAERQQKELEILKKKIENKINETSKIKKVTKQRLAELGALSFFNENSPEHIVKLGERLYLFDGVGEAFYEYDLKTGEIKKLSELNLGKIEKVRVFGERELIINQGTSLAILDTETGDLTPLQITGRGDLMITDFGVYNNKLYVLEASKNLLLKYSKGGNVFNQEAVWLKDNTDIREAVGMAIDGSIWLLTQKGKVLNLLKGARNDLDIEEIKPDLIKPSKVWTGAESKNLYFMDRGSGRIVAMDKQGKVVAQYTADFLRLKDFAVDEVGGVIYVLDDKTIYSFSI